jgi:hypothetical protein
MRELISVKGFVRQAAIRSDGGSYLLDLYKDKQLIETIEFNEHTLSIVQRQANNWVENEQVVRPTL